MVTNLIKVFLLQGNFQADRKQQAFLPDGTDSDLSEQETCKIPPGANKCENVKKTQDIIGFSLGKYCDIDGSRQLIDKFS